MFLEHEQYRKSSTKVKLRRQIKPKNRHREQLFLQVPKVSSEDKNLDHNCTECLVFKGHLQAKTVKISLDWSWEESMGWEGLSHQIVQGSTCLLMNHSINCQLTLLWKRKNIYIFNYNKYCLKNHATNHDYSMRMLTVWNYILGMRRA